MKEHKPKISICSHLAIIIIVCSAILTYTGHLKPIDFITIVFGVIGMVTALTVVFMIFIRSIIE